MAIPIRDSVLTAVPAEPRSERAKRAASDIPPLVEDVGPEPSARPDLDWEAPVTAAAGEDVIAAAVKTLPNAPGVYRMIDADGDVLYVGKARSLKKRVISYTRLAGQSGRIARMISATTTMDFVRTRTETEALLLEANLIKRLRPRFNVLLRDDKSFPYISDRRGSRRAGDHEAPRRAAAKGQLLRPVRLGGSGGSDHQHPAAGVLDQELLRRCLRQPHATLSSLPDQALLGTMHRRDRPGGIPAARRRGEGVPHRIEPGGEGRHCAGDGGGIGRARFRARGSLPRPFGGALARPVPPGDQSARRR